MKSHRWDYLPKLFVVFFVTVSLAGCNSSVSSTDGSSGSVSSQQGDGDDGSDNGGNSSAGDSPCPSCEPPTSCETDSDKTYYYIDYEGGDDGNDGLSPATAWRHAPGDSRASGTAEQTAVLPGDTLRFKGGVAYRGSFSVPHSGTANERIVYAGHCWPDLEGTRAVIDGGHTVNGWTACENQAACGNNPDWQNIYYAPASTPRKSYNANMMQGNDTLYRAQHPDPTDPKFPEDLGSFFRVPHSQTSQTTITDSRLASLGGSALVGASIAGWIDGAGASNRVGYGEITAYDSATNTITFSDLPGTFRNSGGDALYVLLNYVGLISRPGEFAYNPLDSNGSRAYVWPLDGQPDDLTITDHTIGIDLENSNYLDVLGFHIRSYSGGHNQGVAVRSDGGQGVNIQYGEFNGLMSSSWVFSKIAYLDGASNSRIANNYIHDSSHMRGAAAIGGNNNTLSGNYVRRTGGTAILLLNESNSAIVGNTVIEAKGVHVNGVTAYDTIDSTIGENTIINSKTVTFQASSGLWIVNNIIDGHSDTGYVLASWGNMTGPNNLIAHNVLAGSSNDCPFFMIQHNDLKLHNNIFFGEVLKWPQDGSGNQVTGTIVHSNNAYTATCGDTWADKVASDGPGDFFADPADIFVDLPQGDYHPKDTSPTIDAGVHVGVNKDIEGDARPQGADVDVGPYER